MTERLEWQWIDPPHCCRGGGMSATDERQKRGELRECPFCGGEADPPKLSGMSIDTYPPLVVSPVRCGSCGSPAVGVLPSGLFATTADAIAAWNRRSEPELPAEVLRVVAVAKQIDFRLSTIYYRTESTGLLSTLAAYDRWLAGRSESE